MDNLENNSAPVAPSPASDLQDQVASLRTTVTFLLTCSIIVAAAFTFFMYRQARLTRAELDILRPQAEQIDAQYQKLVGPEMEAFGRKLAEYGMSHPDFAPIMTKYGLGKSAAPTGAPPARAAAPAPAPAKK
jgi:hypothetical protein